MPAISGQKAVAAAGTAEALGDIQVNAPLIVKALTTNTNLVYVGNEGNNDVQSTSGMPLAAGNSIVFEWVGNLGALYVDAAVNGEGVAWLSLNV